MARIRIPCLVGKTNKAGITSWYWQPSATLKKAGWAALSLGKDEGQAIEKARARNQEVEQWKLGGAKPAQVRPRIQAGTFNSLIARYRREVLNGTRPNGTARLRERTRENYEVSLKRLEVWAGKHPIAYITPARVRALRDQVARPISDDDDGALGHAAAFSLLKMLRQVMAFAESVEIIPKGSNPANKFDLGAPAARSTVWEAEDDAAFDAAAYDLGLPSMALARELALYSAQREGDLIAFTEPQLQELELFNPALRDALVDAQGRVMGWCFDQSKTSTEKIKVQMQIPLEPKILERVETAIRQNRARDRAATPPRLQTYVLVNDRNGQPWKKRHFIRTWQKILDHAAEHANRPGMSDLVWHDLRRTRVVRLRRRGMPKEMIASITGHSPAAIDMMLKVYGPVDPTVTAAAIVASLDAPTPAPKPSNKAKNSRRRLNKSGENTQ